MVLLSWKHYDLCKLPLHLWIVVDYASVFIFRLLMFVDNGIAARMGLDFGRQQRDAYFRGRIVVLFILYVVIYPFLWAWTIMGSIWFTNGYTCLPEKNQKWGFVVWLLFSYAGLSCLALYSVHKWLRRRKAHIERAQHGIPMSGISEYGVLVDMIRLPDWVFESAAQEMRIMEHDATPHHQGLYLSENQRQALELMIQELPLFSLKAVPTDCSDCPICLEEFRVGDQVRGLPCAHNFHVACIDKWLRLNIRCPRCRCSVFPNLQLNNLPSIPPDPNSSSNVSISHHSQSQPVSQSYFARMQSFLMPVHSENAASSDPEPSTVSTPNIGNNSDVILEVAENEDQPSESHGQPSQNHGQIAENGDQLSRNHGQIAENGDHMSKNHGQPSESHGQLSENYGQPSGSHGQLPENHGQLPENHGQPSENHGQRTSVEYVFYSELLTLVYQAIVICIYCTRNATFVTFKLKSNDFLELALLDESCLSYCCRLEKVTLAAKYQYKEYWTDYLLDMNNEHNFFEGDFF
ncbi:zinc finger, RING/FYVE/PHD-type [Artemisia annua]|uniref:Zinc finger, RING/FYVE/PHD-type n=1 Tax=Artemisia annua TaxID=35608 RepID=A0A2U1N214_ARTAN|nr:zinc finger, RING/FYVE/PHD-type [Artemisia annua]